MNLVWHIVKKDFTRLRLPLLLWTGLLLWGIIISERMFTAGSLEGEWFNRQASIMGVTTFVWVIVCYILAAGLALEDPLVGTAMFWVTRPISGGRLLSAKLLGAALFFLLSPILVSLPWWLWCGFGLADIGYTALQAMVLPALLAVLALALAALAGQSSRFLLWTLVLLLAVPSGTGLVAYYLPKDLSRDLITSRIILAYAVGVVAAMVVIWLQYRSRRLVRSIGVAVAAAAAALLIGFCWPWEMTGLWPKDTTQLPGTEKITLTIGEAKLGASRGGKDWMTLMLTAKDIPQDLAILAGTAQLEFRWPDGTTLQRSAGFAPINPDYTARGVLNLPPAQADPATKQKRQGMAEAYRQRMLERGVKLAAPLPEGVSFMAYVEIPAELVARFATPPAVRAALRLQTGRAELLAEVPLKAGAGQAANGVRLKVLKVETVEPASPDTPATQVTATVITSQPATMRFVQFLLVDRAHGTVIMEGASQIPLPPRWILTVGINRSPLRLNIPQVWREDKWVAMPEWLENDTLATVTYHPNGGFNRELQVDRLEFAKK